MNSFLKIVCANTNSQSKNSATIKLGYKTYTHNYVFDLLNFLYFTTSKFCSVELVDDTFYFSYAFPQTGNFRFG